MRALRILRDRTGSATKAASMVFWLWGGDQGKCVCIDFVVRSSGMQNCMVHLSNFGAWFARGDGPLSSRIIEQPYEALQARARKDHTSFSWYFDDFNLVAASTAAVQKQVAIVFLQSDSGEEYITVDGNEGDR
jgi:hypothetical protein